MRTRLRALLAILVLLAAAWPASADTTAAGPKFSGQLLDVQDGFAFFTTGDGYKLAPTVKIVDAKTGGPPASPPRVKMYARATFDPANGQIVLLELSNTKLPPEAPYEAIHQFALAASTRSENPDLKPNGDKRTGRPVAVIFTVEVPPKTPIGDQVYMTTDQSNWDAQAIRMDRVDALHYRIERSFASGTKLLYLYTRGSWNTVERGANGLSRQPRVFDVRETDTLNKGDAVANWADQNLSAPDLGPNSEPTPFNLNPFPFVTPSPTPRPR
jgi:hypothetical protein